MSFVPFQRIPATFTAIALCCVLTFSSVKVGPESEVAAKPTQSPHLVELSAQVHEQVAVKLAVAQKEAADRTAGQRAWHELFTDLNQKVMTYLKSQVGTYGYILLVQQAAGSQGLNATIGFRQNEPFQMASTFKLPVNLYLYRQIERKNFSLNQQLKYEARFYESGTGILQAEHPGGSYSIRHLAALSIRQSDNVAVNILLSALGRANVINYMHQLGASNSPTEPTPQATPADLAIFLREVEKLAVSVPELGNLLLDDLNHTAYNDRIPAGLPAGTPVAHKIGTLLGVVNDAAIVSSTNAHYILVILSKQVNEAEASQVEARVSHMIWQTLNVPIVPAPKKLRADLEG